MSFEDQLGALNTKLHQVRAEVEAGIASTVTSIHNRIDGAESKIAADFANAHQRLTEMEDGIVRFRDQLLRSFHDLEGRLQNAEASIINLIKRMDRAAGAPAGTKQEAGSSLSAPADDSTDDDEGKGGNGLHPDE